MKKLLLLNLVLYIIMSASATTNAFENIGYNYTVKNEADENSSFRIPIPISYEHQNTLTIFGDGLLNDPRDLFIDDKDILYIADTGNHRIIKSDLSGNVLDIFQDDGQGNTFLNPEGVFVDKTGAIFIADTGNGRIVHLSNEGKYVESFFRPKSDMLGEAFTFNPRRIFVNNSGILYMIQQDTLLTMDAYGNFKGYIGETKIGFSLIRFVIRIFATNEQRRQMGAPVRPSFTSMQYSEDGFVYATVRGVSGQIRKINTIGRNLFPNLEYGERYYNLNGERILPDFIDISVSRKGIVTVLDANLGRLYQYDQDGNNICVFGSGKTPGKGHLIMPVSLETDSHDKIYILDAAQGAVLIYSPTQFINLVHDATYAYYDGKYEKVTEYSEQILELNSNYSLAHYYMGKAYYKQKLWDEAMNHFLLAEDRLNYSRAFEKKRLDFSISYFPFIVLALAILILTLVFGIKKAYRISNKRRDFLIYGNHPDKNIFFTGLSLKLVSMGGVVLFHPSDTFYAVKKMRSRRLVPESILFLSMLIASRFIYIFFLHYPVSSFDLRNINPLTESLAIIVIIVSIALACWNVSEILDGEVFFRESLFGVTLATMPLILFYIPLSVGSNIFGQSEKVFMDIAYMVVICWTAYLLFRSIMVLNDYSFLKTLAICFISLVYIAVLWSIVLMLFVFSKNLWQFVEGIIIEVIVSIS